MNWTENPDFQEGAQKMANELKEDMVGYIYTHFKGGRYIVRDIAIHSETCDALVIYSNFDNPTYTWARPLKMFLSPVDKEKYPEATQETRFEKRRLNG